MKKTIIALMALAGVVQADDTPTYLIKDSDFSYCNEETLVGMLDLQDVVKTFNTGTFAISFDLSTVLDDQGSFDFKFGGGGGGKGYSLAFSYAPNPAPGTPYFPSGEYILTYPNVNLMSGKGLDTAIDADRLIFQVSDFFGDSPTVSLLGYTEGEELETFWSVPVPGSVPSSIETANLRVCGIGDTYTPLDGIDLIIWQGEVTANDIQNPTPAPSPSIPEPATATLSLLALAGLAARRRRR